MRPTEGGESRAGGSGSITAPTNAPGLVYVIVLNWRGAADTIECLETVFRQEYPAFRVIVCDNDSRDGSLEKIRAWAEGASISCVSHDRSAAEAGGAAADARRRLILIDTGGNLGFAGGNNVAIRYALRRRDAAYLWLLNNDAVADDRALSALVQTAEREPRAGMVGSKLLEYAERDRIQTIAGGTVQPWRGLTRPLGAGDLDQGQWEQVFEPDFITGASLLVTEEAVRRVGEMSEDYFLYSEEVDWCLRVRRSGLRLLYSPDSRVWHKGGRSVGHGSSLHDYYTVRSMLLLVRKFYPHLLPVTFVYSLWRCMAPKLVRRQPKRLLAVLRAYRDFLLRRRGGEEAVGQAK